MRFIFKWAWFFSLILLLGCSGQKEKAEQAAPPAVQSSDNAREHISGKKSQPPESPPQTQASTHISGNLDEAEPDHMSGQ